MGKKVWNLRIHKRLKMQALRIMVEVLALNLNLQDKEILNVNRCQFCDEEVENITHLF